jgi:hypothetical protein
MKPELAKVGPAWEGGDLQKWPGVAGVQGVTNHLAHNKNPFLPDPVDSSSTRDLVLKGGKKKSKTRNVKNVKKAKLSKKTKKNKQKKTKAKKTRKPQRGGSTHGNTLLPQSLVNLGRNAEYSIERWWSDLTGSTPPVNPDPSKQPIGM